MNVDKDVNAEKMDYVAGNDEQLKGMATKVIKDVKGAFNAETATHFWYSWSHSYN